MLSSLPKLHALARMMLVRPGEVCEKPGSLLVLECMHDACMMDWQVMNGLLQGALCESTEAESINRIAVEVLQTNLSRFLLVVVGCSVSLRC